MVRAVAFEKTSVAVARIDLRSPGDSFEAGQKLIRALDG